MNLVIRRLLLVTAQGSGSSSAFSITCAGAALTCSGAFITSGSV
jgi:hypothetical protein